MKYTICFFALLIISCHLRKVASDNLVRGNGYKIYHDTIEKKIITEPIIIHDTIIDTSFTKIIFPLKEDLIIIDTTLFKIYFQEFKDSMIAVIDNSHSIQNNIANVIAERYKKSIEKNDSLIMELANVRIKKKKSDIVSEASNDVLFDIPTLMFGLLVLFFVIVIFRQSYFKNKVIKALSNVKK